MCFLLLTFCLTLCLHQVFYDFLFKLHLCIFEFFVGVFWDIRRFCCSITYKVFDSISTVFTKILYSKLCMFFWNLLQSSFIDLQNFWTDTKINVNVSLFLYKYCDKKNGLRDSLSKRCFDSFAHCHCEKQVFHCVDELLYSQFGKIF